MTLFDRFRLAIAGLGQALGGHRPGVELVRVDRPELPSPPLSRPLWALPGPEHPVCPRCGDRHEPRPVPGRTGRGISAYARVIAPDMGTAGQPEPLGRSSFDPRPLLRDQANPWRHGTPDPPPPDTGLAEIRAELHAPRTYWWEDRQEQQGGIP